MAKPIYEAPFTVDVTGDRTGESLQGVFKAKTRLSHRERLLIDQLKRQLLGPQPAGTMPSEDADSRADAFANLRVRLTESPSWWMNSNGGIELVDDNVVTAVFEKAVQVEVDAINAIKEAAAKAKAELTQEAASK